MAVDHGRGFNPMHGFDLLPPPPALNSIHPTGFQTFPSFPGFGVPQQQPMFAAQQTAYAPAQFPPYPIFPGFQGYQGYGQPQPAPPPFIPPGFPPNLNLINHKGGFGLPPGYDYAFPREHCKIHVFKTGNTPPWQMTIHSADTTLHTKLYVPCNVSFSLSLLSRILPRLVLFQNHSQQSKTNTHSDNSQRTDAKPRLHEPRSQTQQTLRSSRSRSRQVG